MAHVFSLSNASICSIIASNLIAPSSTTFIEVLRSKIAFVIVTNLFLILPDLKTDINCLLIIGCSSSPNNLIWIDCWEGVGEYFVPFTSLASDFRYSYRSFIYLHCLLALGEPRKGYLPSANHHLPKGLI